MTRTILLHPYNKRKPHLVHLTSAGGGGVPQIISHQAVLEAVAGFRSFDKIHCLSACLDIVSMVEVNITQAE